MHRDGLTWRTYQAGRLRRQAIKRWARRVATHLAAALAGASLALWALGRGAGVW